MKAVLCEARLLVHARGMQLCGITYKFALVSECCEGLRLGIIFVLMNDDICIKEL